MLKSPGKRLEAFICQSVYANAIELYVFDSKDNMNKAIKKWILQNKYTNTEELDVAGIVFEVGKERYIKDEITGDKTRVFAVMFLCEEYLTASIIAHECVHAAMTLEQNVLRFMGLYEKDDGSGYCSEERLAYTVDDFVNNIVKKCIDKKLKIKFVMEKKKK